jgi:hypothetical protein
VPDNVSTEKVVPIRRAKIKIVREPTVMLFPVGTTFDDWSEAVKELQGEHRSILIWLGDAFLFGTDKFGELAASAVGSYSAETIDRAMRVCRAIPPQRRRDVGFSFLQAVEKLPPEDQDELLALAEKHDWTREAMRDAVREKRQLRDAAETSKRQASQPELPRGEPTREPEPAPPSGREPAADDDDDAESVERTSAGAEPPRAAAEIDRLPARLADPVVESYSGPIVSSPGGPAGER